MGVDPSYVNVGWGIIYIDDDSGLFSLCRYGTVYTDDQYSKTSGEGIKYKQYKEAAKELKKIGQKHKVKQYVFEDMFIKSFMMRSVEARAVLMADLSSCYYLDTFNALKAKKMFIEKKKPTKKDMILAMQKLLRVNTAMSDHEADALAVACGWYITKYVEELDI